MPPRLRDLGKHSVQRKQLTVFQRQAQRHMGRALRRALKNVLDTVLRALASISIVAYTSEQVLVRICHWLPKLPGMDALTYHWVFSALEARPGSDERVAVVPGGGRVAVTTRDYFHRHLYFTGEYETETTHLLRSLLSPGDVFIDVGANVGYFTSVALAQGAVVHAFEPNPNLSRLVERAGALNAAANRFVFNRVALASANGSATFYLSPDVHNSGLSSLVELGHLGASQELTVPTATLDSYCRANDLRRIRLIKIDVEGAEEAVLAGAAETLTDIRPDAIICEVGGCSGGSDPGQIVRRLGTFGYVPHLIKSSGLRPLLLSELTAGARTAAQLPPNLCFLPV